MPNLTYTPVKCIPHVHAINIPAEYTHPSNIYTRYTYTHLDPIEFRNGVWTRASDASFGREASDPSF